MGNDDFFQGIEEPVVEATEAVPIAVAVVIDIEVPSKPPTMTASNDVDMVDGQAEILDFINE